MTPPSASLATARTHTLGRLLSSLVPLLLILLSSAISSHGFHPAPSALQGAVPSSSRRSPSGGRESAILRVPRGGGEDGAVDGVEQAPFPEQRLPLNTSAAQLISSHPQLEPTLPSTQEQVADGLKPLRAWPKNRDPRGVPPDFPLTAARVSIAAASTVLTWYAHARAAPARCGPVLASSAVTLAASLAAPGLGQAAFCGSFAGMSSAALLPGWTDALAVGAATSALFEVLIHVRNAFLGLGGRLGFVAFVAVNVAMAVRGVPAVAEPTVSKAPVAVMTIAAAVGSAATIALRESSDDAAAADPVRAAAVIGVLAALLVGTLPGYTDLAALAAYGGAFTGMSLPSRLVRGVVPGKTKGPAGALPQSQPGPAVLLTAFAAAGALGGWFHALTIGWGWWSNPAGWGGKAGFCAFVGVVAYRVVAKAAALLLGRS